MSTTIEINGVNLIPLKEAATAVSYSRDYVARLAREEKIVASQIGRQWFVDPISLERFVIEAKSLEEVRKEELRAERKHELIAKQALTTLQSEIKKTESRHRLDALTATLAVLCVGVFTGVGLYTALLVPEIKLASLIAPFVETSNLELGSGRSDSNTLALQSAPTVPGASESPPGRSPFQLVGEAATQETLVLTTIEERPIFTTERTLEPLTLTSAQEGILLFAKQGAVRTEAAVASLFSDPVAVEFTSERSGVVTFTAATGAVTTYPFVTLPVQNRATTQVEQTAPPAQSISNQATQSASVQPTENEATPNRLTPSTKNTTPAPLSSDTTNVLVE